MRRIVERIYALLLYAYPPALRREHGADMRACTREALRDRGLAAVPRLALDLFLSVPREWALLLKGFTMTGVAKDVTYAVRMLWRSPGFTAAAVLTLALGIGANAAIFSLADATLLRPLKVGNPSELHVIRFTNTYPDFLAYQQNRQMFAGVAGSSGGSVNVAVDGRAELRGAAFVSGNYFDVLGVPPAAGRVFTPADDERNGPGVAVLTERWWRTRFGADPAIIGRTIRVNNVPITVIGVAGRDFHGTSFSDPVQLFLPLTHTPRIQTGFFSRPDMLDKRNISWVNVLLRLAPGVTPAAAATAAESIYRQFHPVSPGDRPEPLTLTPLVQRSLGADVSNVMRFVVILGTVVGLTLLIGCANLANLLLSRAAGRRREIGVRMAIGAGPARVARQLLIESLVLAVFGGAASIVIADLGLALLGRFQLPGGIEIDALDLSISGTVLGFTALVSCLTGVLFGMVPAWQAARTDVLQSLRDDSRGASARSGLRSTLLGAQVAVSLVLLAGTGLFLRSLVASLRTDLGFRVDHVATASVKLGAARYDTARARAFYDEALARVKQLPGVTSAAWSTVIPTLGSRSMSVIIEGHPAAPQEDVHAYSTGVTPEYFAAVGTRILRGREFTATDIASAPWVGIINETAARLYFSGRDPIGGRIKMDDRWIQVVGVAEDARQREIDEKTEPLLYSPYAQDPFGDAVNNLHLLVRTSGDEEALLGPLATTLRSIDPNAPVYDVSTFAWRVRRLIMPQRMGATLFGAFAALALVLATVGIYGVASYVAKLRSREIGIRIALGADGASIRALLLRGAAAPVGLGVLAGLAIAIVCSQFAVAFLHGVPPRDPLTYASVAALLVGVAVCATLIPARRAARLDPVVALRQE
jgi:predicted permease